METAIRRLAKALSAIVVLVALWLFASAFLAARWEAAADRAWADLGLPIADLLARHPKQGPSTAARALRSPALALGIALESDDRPDAAAATALDAALRAQGLDDLERTGDVVPPLSPPAGAYLAAHAADVDALRAILQGKEPVAWPEDMARAFDAPLPAIRGLRQLHGVLLLDAFARAAAGDGEGAETSLGAAWQLVGSLRNRAEVVSQTLAASLDQKTLAALLRLPTSRDLSLPPGDRRAGLEGAWAAEAWVMREYARSGSGLLLDEPDTPFRRLVTDPLQRPYVRLAAADYGVRLAAMVADLRTRDACTLDADAFDRELPGRVPGWNLLGEIATHPLARARVQIARADAAAELLQKVREVRARRAADGQWPPSIPATPSAVCPGAQWTVATSATGATVSLPPAFLAGRDAPLRFEIAAR